MKVLLVEDAREMQTPIGSGLRAFGYRVDVAKNADRAIKKASDKTYDIIILDLFLPTEVSLLVLHEIRELDRNVDILILSSRDQIHDRVTALIQGANDYMVKPFSFEELDSRIRELVQRKQDLVSCRLDEGNHEETSTRLNRLIENLRRHCNCRYGGIELVISEIKLTNLLEHVCLDLRREIQRKNIQLLLPGQKLPTLLVDARWMQHLLVNLLAYAIRQSPPGAKVTIDCETDAGYCALKIETQLTQPVERPEIGALLRKICDLDPEVNENDPVALFLLLQSYAEYMNLGLDAIIGEPQLLQIWVSNIKIV